MSTVGFLYPGFSAEDDYPRAEKLLADGSRLALVHTEMATDAHREDALLAIGGDEVLAEGARRVAAEAGPLDAVVWACTSGSFIFGPTVPPGRSRRWNGCRVCRRRARRSPSSTPVDGSGSARWRSGRPTRPTSPAPSCIS